MSREQDRAAARERQAAKLLGSTRVLRRSKQTAPDVVPIRLPNGDLLQPEVKNGLRRCPRSIVKALEQAARYTRGAVPVAVFSDVGGQAIACLPLKDLARWLGTSPEKMGVQLCLAFGSAPDPRQMEIPGT